MKLSTFVVGLPLILGVDGQCSSGVKLGTSYGCFTDSGKIAHDENKCWYVLVEPTCRLLLHTDSHRCLQHRLGVYPTWMPNMTHRSCAIACKSNGLPGLIGVESGNMCWCSNYTNTSHLPPACTSTVDSDCKRTLVLTQVLKL